MKSPWIFTLTLLEMSVTTTLAGSLFAQSPPPDADPVLPTSLSAADDPGLSTDDSRFPAPLAAEFASESNEEITEPLDAPGRVYPPETISESMLKTEFLRLPAPYTEYRSSGKRYYHIQPTGDCYQDNWQNHCWNCDCRKCRFHRRTQAHSLAMDEKLGRWFGKERRRIATVAAMSRMQTPGTVLDAMMGRQVSNANAAQMMLYENDFVFDAAELTVRGYRELMQRAIVLRQTDYVLRIEVTAYNPELADARRSVVLSELSRLLGGPIPEDRVVISEPLSRGLDGVDAIPLQARLLQTSAGARGDSTGGGIYAGTLVGSPITTGGR